ncbi:tRNA-dihydrouridine synthase family protein [Candidatus Micrarchaeota archaeon]|nr:tRNA-dihydrouridine synthase family protein [Candidatus Micrarchaeota archaeon]
MYRSFLSPINDYSNLPFRLLCQKYGAEATCIPLINATRVVSSKIALDANPKEKNLGIQLVNNNPREIGKACKIIDALVPFVSWYNINCGCPSSRTMGYGGGSAMLEFPEKIVESALEMKKNIDKPVSVKIRMKPNFAETLSLCKKLENVDVDFLIIHGRTAKQGYSGNADWEAIKALKKALSIPIVGNGDIMNAQHGEEMIKQGYCDSFMICRAAMSNPMVFINSKARARVLLEEYISLCNEYLGKAEVHDVKIKAINFLRGSKNAAASRNRIMKAKTIEELILCVDALHGSETSSRQFLWQQ